MNFMTGFTDCGSSSLIRNCKFLGVVVCCCDNNAWNRIGSCCEGTVKCPVGWSKFETWLCVMACLNNMQCVEM